MTTPRIKICGLRDPYHAQTAALAGADYLGFVFVDGVRRQLSPEAGASIIKRYRNLLSEDALPGPQIVGLFRNQPAQWVNAVAARASLDYVQLCGDEDVHYYRRVEWPIFRQVRVRHDTPRNALRNAVESHLDAGRMVVLDAYDSKTPGGAGKPFDWSLAEGIASLEGVFLAGGLTPDNVAEAIEQLHPWGVDVSSGVETNGEKDHDKIQSFITAALG